MTSVFCTTAVIGSSIVTSCIITHVQKLAHIVTRFSTDAHPQILVVDDIGMLSGNLNRPPGRIERVSSQMCRDFCGPGFEASTVGIVADAADHKVGQMTELVRQCVDQSVFAVDDLVGKLDRGKMLNSRDRGLSLHKGAMVDACCCGSYR